VKAGESGETVWIHTQVTWSASVDTGRRSRTL
jgi:hypothetical protein